MAITQAKLSIPDEGQAPHKAENRINSSLWVDCDQCPLLSECGGLDTLDRSTGCFMACQQRQCGDRFNRKGKPAWICLCDTPRYIQAMRETGGWNFKAPQLRVPENLSLPLFVPTVQHKSSRIAGLDTPVVALPLPEVLSFVRRTAVPLTPALLRQEFRLAPGSHVLLLCSCVDQSLELLWAISSEQSIASRLAALGLWAATLPNYSFFTDAPRPDNVINRRRSLIIGKKWTAAGLATIPHLNAITIADWEYWFTLLKEQPHITYVAKEFQTGLKNKEKGHLALEQLVRLQDKLDRELRPIVIGGTKHLPQFARYFAHPTFIESTPFMFATNRQEIVRTPPNPGAILTIKKQKHPTEPGMPIDELLRANIITRQECIELAWIEAKRTAASHKTTMQIRGENLQEASGPQATAAAV